MPIRRRDEALAPSESALRRRIKPRLPDFDYKGEFAYHVILSTKDRQQAFQDLEFGKQAAALLVDLAEKLSFRILAYCFMPDHCHLLVQGAAESADLKHFVQRFKQGTGFHYKKATGIILWQQSFFDRALRRDEDVRVVADYVLGNPVHAGLSEDAASYPLSGGEIHLRAVFSDGAKASSLRVSGLSDD